MNPRFRPQRTVLPYAAVMGFAGTTAQNSTPVVIHSATIRSGLEVADDLASVVSQAFHA